MSEAICPACGRGTTGPDRVCPACIAWKDHGICACPECDTTWSLIRQKQQETMKMGSGNLKADDRFMVRVSSDVYGDCEHGPYDTLDQAREVRGRLKLAADLLNDGIERHCEVILLTENTGEGAITYRDKPDCPVVVEPPSPIVVTVEGGVVQSIDNIPPGQVVQVWDFDTDCAEDEEGLQENEQGERFYLSEYVGRAK